MTPSIYSIPLKNIDGGARSLDEYRGKVLLIVNVASRCGFTPQYRGLEDLYLKYRDRGLVVLGFPCNQFGAQEPGTEAEIKGFCEAKFGVSFPLFAKIEVNGKGAHPLYRYLKEARPGLLGSKTIKWNFTKFLVSRDGAVLQRFAPGDDPASLEPAIVEALGKPGG